jgi:hypothetical protein
VGTRIGRAGEWVRESAERDAARAPRGRRVPMAEIQWRHDLMPALDEARAGDKAVLIDFFSPT